MIAYIRFTPVETVSERDRHTEAEPTHALDGHQADTWPFLEWM